MKKLIVLAVAVMALIGSAVAMAATTHTVTSKASPNRAGTKAKPAPFVGEFRYSVVGDGGNRGPAPNAWIWKWDGVQTNGAKFPKCTPEQIDAAQSDSVCPKGSLVAEAPLLAQLGPVGDKTQNVKCEGKTGRIYNAGPNKATYYMIGPGDKCAGVGYLAPVPLTLKTVSGTTTWTFVLPTNLSHPLPGIEGSINFFQPIYKPVTVRAGSKKIPFMTSTSCKGKRKFTMTIKDDEGTTVTTASAGACKK